MKRWPYILLASLWTAILLMPPSGFSAGYLFLSYLTPTPTPTATATATSTATPTATPTPPPPTAEPIYYLSGIGQTTGYKLTPKVTYGNVGLAGRVGWAWIQPTQAGGFNWSVVDDFQKAAHAANSGAGTLWSLSISAGAYSPLWMFNSGGSFPCPTSTTSNRGSAPTNDPPSGSGTLQAFQFIWNASYVFPSNSVQCAPVPWDTNFQTAWQTLINTAAAHAAPGLDPHGNPYPTLATDPLLDHVVITGINSFTQELWLPFCTTPSASCGAGGSSDITRWEALVVAAGGTCTGNSLALCPGFDNPTAANYTGLIQTAFVTIAGYWATAFPTKKLAVMYVDSSAFPFNVGYPSVSALKILNHAAALYPTSSYLMSNAVVGTSPYMPNKIWCYTTGVTGCQPPPTGFVQPTAIIAGQEGTGIAGGSPACPNLTTLTTTLTNLFSPIQSQFLEVYDNDVACLP